MVPGTDIEHVVDRHDAAIIEEATTIAQMRRQIALITEAFEKLDLCRSKDWKIIRNDRLHATDIAKFFNN